MLEKAFNDVYTKFKLHFYQNVFQRFATREATLTTVESFCMEGIMARWCARAMWKRSSPPPTAGSITCGPPRSISTTTTSATPT